MENINHQPQHDQSYISQMRVNLPKIAQFMQDKLHYGLLEIGKIAFALHNTMGSSSN